MAVINQSALPYLLLALMGGNPGGNLNDDNVQVSLNTDNFDGTVSVPQWVLAQAAGSTLGFYPTNRQWAYDDDTLPASIRMDSDWYEIRVDLGSFDQDRAKVKVVDSRTVRVEARRRDVNRYGVNTARTVSRRFPVPRTYDVYRLEARTNNYGILTIQIPNRNGNVFSASRNDGYVRVDYK